MTTGSHDRASVWWRDRLILGAGAICLIWALLSLTWPMSGGTGLLEWTAAVVRGGGVPYRDVWETRGPVAWLPSLGLQSVAGPTHWGLRVLGLGALLVGIAAVRQIATRFEQPGRGRVAIAFLLVWHANLTFAATSLPETWVAALLVTACAAVLRATRASTLLAGLCLALAAGVRIEYGVLLLPLTLLTLVTTTPDPQSRGARVLALLAGAAIGSAAWVGALAALGALPAFAEVVRWQWEIGWRGGLGGDELSRTALVEAALLPWGGIMAPVALFGVIRSTRRYRSAIQAIGLMLLLAIAVVWVQPLSGMEAWLPALPLLAVLVDIGFAALRVEVAGGASADFRRFALTIMLGYAALSPVQFGYRWLSAQRSAERRQVFARREYGRFYGAQAGGVRALADSLFERDTATQRVVIWAQQPAPLLRHRTPVATRFVALQPLYEGAPDTWRARYRAQFLREQQRAPAAWFLIPAPALLAEDYPLERYGIDRFPELAAMLQSAYEPVAQTPDWIALRRRTEVRP